MSKDKLFLLKAEFMDGDQGPFYCPGCAYVSGVLGYFPGLRDELDIQYVDFPRPRPAIVAEVGEENQGAPVLVLGQKAPPAPGLYEVKEFQGRSFISGAKDILEYLAATYNISRPHP